jgi:hypothetical protein
MSVAWSNDGGTTWDGGGGTLPGSAAAAYQVDPSSLPQTDVFPAIAAGSPGKVDVAWLLTSGIEPTGPSGKFDPGGCAGPGNGNPDFYPPTCNWNLYAGQSLDLTDPPGKAAWTTGALTTTPMHIGDICNLGIFCLAPSSNRNLLDFISVAVDADGNANAVWTDDASRPELGLVMMYGRQTSGPGVGRSGPQM